MKCPVDSIDLIMSERSGVEIDYCPQCRGVWLDRGELDKIIDRAAEVLGPAAAAATRRTAATDAAATFRRRCTTSTRAGTTGVRTTAAMTSAGTMTAATAAPARYEQPRYDDRRRPKKKEGWLGDLFDF